MPKSKSRVSKLPALLGKRLKERRVQLEMTQAGLAEMVGVDPETISRIERGAALPGLLRLEAIADALKVGVASLIQSSSSVAEDQALQIAIWLKTMNEHDREFVVDYVKKYAEHRKPRVKRS